MITIVLIDLIIISAIVVANVVYWKRLKDRKKQDNDLTIDKIMDCIKKEGYFPLKYDKENIYFKIQGEPIDVMYDHDGLLIIAKRYHINKEDIPTVEKAAIATMAETPIIQIYTTTDDAENWLIFAISNFVTSSSYFETRLLNYIQLLYVSIYRHKSYCKEISEESVNKQGQNPGYELTTNTSSFKS